LAGYTITMRCDSVARLVIGDTLRESRFKMSVGLDLVLSHYNELELNYTKKIKGDLIEYVITKKNDNNDKIKTRFTYSWTSNKRSL